MEIILLIRRRFTTYLDSFIEKKEREEVLSADPTLRNLKKIGVDLESAIYNGFKKVFPTLYRLLCIRHISERDRQKLGKLLELIKMREGQKNKAKAEILKDLYGERKGNSYEYGLAEAFDEKRQTLFASRHRVSAFC